MAISNGSEAGIMVVRRIASRFDIAYSRRIALRVADWLGFSTCKPWSIPYNISTPEEQEFIKDNRDIITRWR